jgi:hypothetical protein
MKSDNSLFICCLLSFLFVSLSFTNFSLSTENHIQKDQYPTPGEIIPNDSVMYEQEVNKIGIGYYPERNFEVFGSGASIIVEDTEDGASSITNTMPGTEMVINSAIWWDWSLGPPDWVHWKYYLGLKFLSDDSDFDDRKLLAMIIPENTEDDQTDHNNKQTQQLNTDPGTDLWFLTTKDGPSSGDTHPLEKRMVIKDEGKVGIVGDNTIAWDETYDEVDYTLDVNGDFSAEGFVLLDHATSPKIIAGKTTTTATNTIGATVYGSVVTGGNYNDINGDYGVVSGGYNNDINQVFGSPDHSVISGGYDNEISGQYATIAGGIRNTASGDYSFVAGGQRNTASGDYSTVLGGYYNTAYGDYSITTGDHCSASGDRSFAGGWKATASHDYSFVWSDGEHTSFSSTTTNEFRVHAKNGAYFSNDVYCDPCTDRTPYPENKEAAYAAVMSMQRLPDGEYDPDDSSMQLDHSSLTEFVRHDHPDGTIGRNLSATVSCHVEVLKDLATRTQALEQFLNGI